MSGYDDYRCCQKKGKYEDTIKTRDNQTVLDIVADENQYRYSRRPAWRMWWRLAVVEAKKRGLTT